MLFSRAAHGHSAELLPIVSVNLQGFSALRYAPPSDWILRHTDKLLISIALR